MVFNSLEYSQDIFIKDLIVPSSLIWDALSGTLARAVKKIPSGLEFILDESKLNGIFRTSQSKNILIISHSSYRSIYEALSDLSKYTFINDGRRIYPRYGQIEDGNSIFIPYSRFPKKPVFYSFVKEFFVNRLSDKHLLRNEIGMESKRKEVEYIGNFIF